MYYVKVANINSSNNQNFKSIYTNKLLKSTFKFAEENGTLFAATTSLVLSGVARPLIVLSTPQTDKENKQYAASKSIASSLTGFVILLLASIPVAKAMKKIDREPLKYLKKETVNNLTHVKNDLKNSKPYIFATQLFKLGLGFFIAAPKAMLTCLLIPPVMNKIFNKKDKSNKIVSFKATPKTDFLPELIGKVIDKPFVQKTAKKFQNSNYEMAIISGTDIVATLGFIYQNKKNKKISNERKKVLNYNVIYATTMSILGACTLDKLLEKKTNKFIENFKKANPNLENIAKYAEGIKIAKKVFILGGLYYCVIPFFATFLSEKAQYKGKDKNNK